LLEWLCCFRLEWLGLDWLDLDWLGLDWLGLDWLGLDWLGLDWLGLGPLGLDLFRLPRIEGLALAGLLRFRMLERLFLFLSWFALWLALSALYRRGRVANPLGAKRGGRKLHPSLLELSGGTGQAHRAQVVPMFFRSSGRPLKPTNGLRAIPFGGQGKGGLERDGNAITVVGFGGGKLGFHEARIRRHCGRWHRGTWGEVRLNHGPVYHHGCRNAPLRELLQP
jgi:hypothetical protein